MSVMKIALQGLQDIYMPKGQLFFTWSPKIYVNIKLKRKSHIFAMASNHK